jgi:hypothetical protein
VPACGNSRRPSPTPLKVTNPGIGIDPSDANSWPLRSPGILSRRALCRFLPLRWQLLDQPPRRMRNPSHQLNDEAGANDVPSRPPARDRNFFASTTRRFNRLYQAKCLGIAGEIASSPSQNCWNEMRSVLRNGRLFTAGSVHFFAAAFSEAPCTDCNRPAPRSVRRLNRERPVRFFDRGLPPRSAASWR